MQPQLNCILLIDDNDDDNFYHRIILSEAGVTKRIEVAETGYEALDFLQRIQQAPELIFLDINMPRMNGWEFLQRQRLDWHLCTIPTIVVSGVASHDPRCLEMPIVRILPKPYTVDQLVAAIDAEISTRQAPDPPIMLRATPRPAPVPLRRIRI